MNEQTPDNSVEPKLTAVCPHCSEAVPRDAFFQHVEDNHPEKHVIYKEVDNGPKLYVGEDGKGVLKFSGTPPKYVVEACFVECLKEMSNTMAATSEGGSEKMTTVQSFNVALAIWAAELHNLNELLKPTQRATLSSKHKLLFDMIPLWLLRVELLRGHLDTEMTDTDGVIIGAARECISIITAFHTLLSEEVSMKEKRQFYKEFKEKFDACMEDA